MMDYYEFDITTIYQKSSIVWFGELAYICKDLAVCEFPDISKSWKVYIK